MRTRFQYINFTKTLGGRLVCINNRTGDELGFVTWDTAWQQNVFSQSGPGIVFSAGCLRDIASFLEELPPAPRKVAEAAPAKTKKASK